MTIPTKVPPEKEETGFYEAYKNLAQTFRGWLIAYGIGGPVVLISNTSVVEELKNMSDSWKIIFAFLIGTFLQTILA